MDSPTLQYGPIVGVHNVDDGLIQLLQKWFQSYLNEVARQNGEPFERLIRPRNYRASHEIEFMPEDQRPCCVVVCQGTEGEPIRRASPDGTGQTVSATWNYRVAVQVVANGQKIRSMPRAHQLAMMYISAARVALENQSSDIVSMGIDWQGEEPGEVDSDSDRTTAVGIGNFRVTVFTTHIHGIGPAQPEADPLPESPHYPAVESGKVHLDITKVPTGGEV